MANQFSLRVDRVALLQWMAPDLDVMGRTTRTQCVTEKKKRHKTGEWSESGVELRGASENKHDQNTW